MTRPFAPVICALLVGAFAAGGCIYVPCSDPDRRSLLIGTEPDKPLRIGETHRDAVAAKLGKPSYSTEHDLAWGYLFGATTGHVLGLYFTGPCSNVPGFGVADVGGNDDVWLEFAADGTLRRCEKRLSDRFGGDSSKAWRAFIKDVPDNGRPQ